MPVPCTLRVPPPSLKHEWPRKALGTPSGPSPPAASALRHDMPGRSHGCPVLRRNAPAERVGLDVRGADQKQRCRDTTRGDRKSQPEESCVYQASTRNGGFFESRLGV